MKSILVIAPHADDETLGCAGTILRHLSEGDSVHWLLLSQMVTPLGSKPQLNTQRDQEISAVNRAYPFTSFHSLQLPAANFGEIPLSQIIENISAFVKKVSPHTIYLPFEGDAHSDHAIAFQASIACTKWFRYPFVKRVLAYETLSETEFALNPSSLKFHPNVFIDITAHLEKKIEIMKLYTQEMGSHPFPRSEESIRALAKFRGSSCGTSAAESFLLLKEVL